MKKLKLFLLLGLVTLFGISSFLNAGFIELNDVVVPPDSQFHVIYTINSDGSVVGNVTLKYSYSGPTLQLCKGSTAGCGQYAGNLSNGDGTLDINFNNNNTTLYARNTYSNQGVFSSLVIDNKFIKTPLFFSLNKSLKPAVTGLQASVIELIPYVIYISIGLLLVTLGFYAIRRLVNRIGGKVNSNFKFKR